MLILPLGHAQRVRAAGRFTARERRMMGAVLAVVAALGVVVVVALATGSHTSANGCVEVTLPYSTGGQEFYACGSRARELCASAGRPGAPTGPAAQTVATQCRKAGLRVGG